MIDKREFETLFRRHYDGMFRLARRMLNDDADSKDVVSEVFAQLLHSGADLKSETLQAYLLTSVRNRCVNLLVHKQREMQRNEEFYSGGQQAQKAVVVEMVNPEQTAEQVISIGIRHACDRGSHMAILSVSLKCKKHPFVPVSFRLPSYSV